MAPILPALILMALIFGNTVLLISMHLLFSFVRSNIRADDPFSNTTNKSYTATTNSHPPPNKLSPAGRKPDDAQHPLAAEARGSGARARTRARARARARV